jgi:adenosylmethionine-8-amino-7-oxononanoate aminotransferase
MSIETSIAALVEDETGQPYPYRRVELVEPDWTRFPGWKDVTAAEWESVQWQRSHCVKNLKQLREVLGDLVDERFYADLERDQAERATMSMLVPPQMLNTMAPHVTPKGPGSLTDAFYADPVRHYMLPVLSDRRTDWPSHPHATRDSLHEHDMWAVEGLTHRYPTKVLAELLPTCPQYCGHCTRMDLVGNSTPTVEKLKLTGKPMKHKVISRAIAYHGTTQGALSITGLPLLKQQFEPLVPSTFRVPNTNYYRSELHPGFGGGTLEEFGRWAADQIAVAIEAEGPDTVAAVFLEPVQNAGGCFPPPPGYWQRVREICDEYDVLLVSDEVICAFGRLGHMFGAERFDYQPDMITCAKGLTSGYSPLGAMIASRRLMEPFRQGAEMFAHGYTFGGHPVSTAVGLKNLQIFEEEKVLDHVRSNEDVFRTTLERLLDLPIVGDVRGEGYFYGIELVKDKNTKESFTDEECERILFGFVSKQLYAEGLYCRADDRGDPVVQLAPPLICDQSHFDEIEQILRVVLDKASSML